MNRLICIMICLGQVMTLTWGQNLNLTFSGYIIYHSTRLDKRNIKTSWWLNYSPSEIMSEVMLKKLFEAKLSIFFISWPLEVKLLIWGQIWRHTSGRAVNGPSFTFLCAALALLVHELERLKLRIVEVVENREHFTFDASGDLTFDPTWKIT